MPIKIKKYLDTAHPISKRQMASIIETIEKTKKQMKIIEMADILEEDKVNALIAQENIIHGMELVLISLGYEIEDESREKSYGN